MDNTCFEYEDEPVPLPSSSKGIGDVFTEDGVLVRKIYVPQLHADTDELSLKKTFSKFGKIENVLIKKKKNTAYGFVTFFTSKDAATALRLSYSNVKPADTWHQPHTAATNDSENTKNVEDEEENYDINEKESLLLLNDDCLLQVFTYLDLFDLRNVEAVCSHFSNLVKLIYKRHRIVDFNSIKGDTHITLMESRYVLMQIGKYIKELKIVSSKYILSNRRLIEMIPKYCKNLEVLKLEGITMKGLILNKYLKLFKQFKILELNKCHVSEQIDKCFDTANSLETLDLSENYELTGRCLTKLRNLKHLNIYNCTNIQSKYFSEFCIKNKTLKRLNISRCDRLNVSSFNDIVKHLVNLEDLVISNVYPLCNTNDICKLAHIAELKKLCIHFTSFSNVDSLLNELTIKNQLESLDISCVQTTDHTINIITKFSKLKELKISYKLDITDEYICQIARKGLLTHLELIGCCSVTNSGLLKCIELCPDLEFLDVSGCYGITEKFIYLLPDVLLKKTRPNKMIIAIGGTQVVTTHVIHRQSPFLLKYKHIFDLSFENNYLSHYNDYVDSDDEYYPQYEDEDNSTDSEYSLILIG